MIINSSCIGKHGPLTYKKNEKKTFEILRSEITFLMDLYCSTKV